MLGLSGGTRGLSGAGQMLPAAGTQTGQRETEALGPNTWKHLNGDPTDGVHICIIKHVHRLSKWDTHRKETDWHNTPYESFVSFRMLFDSILNQLITHLVGQSMAVAGSQSFSQSLSHY